MNNHFFLDFCFLILKMQFQWDWSFPMFDLSEKPGLVLPYLDADLGDGH